MRQNRFARRVNMEVASHTALMDPILPELRAALADLTPKSPAIPFFSTVVRRHRGASVLDAEYWVANVRQPAGSATGHCRSRTGPRHLHRDQRSSDADSRRQRNAGFGRPITTAWRRYGAMVMTQ